ncbi:MAG: phosphodiester glycosidase family protein, partial [Armatimonadetes bacterium]|nr:phosphodiester glycosidase family protein [Armatimonadota bacterium]
VIAVPPRFGYYGRVIIMLPVTAHNRSLTLLLAALILSATRAAAGDAQVTLLVNGAPPPGVEALADDRGRLLLPEPALLHALGLQVSPGEGGAPWVVRGCGRVVQVRPGSRQYRVGEETLTASTATVLRDDGLAIPVEMLASTFGIEATAYRDGDRVIWSLSTSGAGVVDVREGPHRDRVRLVIDLDRPACFTWWSEPGRVVIELPAAPDADARARSVRLIRCQDPLAGPISQGPTTTGVIRVSIGHNSPHEPRVFSLGDPARIVVDLLRAEEDYLPIPEVPTAPGLLQVRNFGTPRGPVRVLVYDIDPRSDDVAVRPALASATIRHRASVTRICINTGAYGGVNGGFFSYRGPPLGMLVIDGEWIHQPRGGRTVLGITRDGRLLMDRLTFDGRVVFAGLGAQRLSAINEGHSKPDTLVMYTRRWGWTVAGAKGRTRLVVDGTGRVIAKTTDGDEVSIPEGGFVLSGNGRMARSLQRVELGTVVTPELRTRPQWPDVLHAVGGGPRLVKDGKPHITAAPEKFRPDVYASITSRTAVGITKDGRLLLVVVEGGAASPGRGMTLSELASTMIKLGAWQAMNLDGGGSSTFVADGRLINLPSDGVARSVSNALLVFREREAGDGER